MKILVPVDGSHFALDAVRYALRLKREGLDASFVLATVQETNYLIEVLLAPGAEVLDRVTGAVGSRALESAEAFFEADGVPYSREVGSGDTAETLLQIAADHECDAIVMGSRGWGILRGVLIGSVSQAILHKAAVPVTIVKHPATHWPDD